MRICKYLIAILWAATTYGAVAGQSATVYFSPEDHVEERLISLIEKEKKSIYIAVYSLSHRKIAAALIDAKKRGVDVEIIVDRFSVKVKSPLMQMSQQGIPIYVWDSDPERKKKAHRPLMHNKFCVFGNELVWTGSFNWTYEASRNHEENVVVFRDPVLAGAFKNQFSNIQFKSCIPLTSYIAYKKKVS